MKAGGESGLFSDSLPASGKSLQPGLHQIKRQSPGQEVSSSEGILSMVGLAFILGSADAVHKRGNGLIVDHHRMSFVWPECGHVDFAATLQSGRVKYEFILADGLLAQQFGLIYFISHDVLLLRLGLPVKSQHSIYSVPLSIRRVLPMKTAIAICVPRLTFCTGAKVCGSKNSM